MQNAASLGFGLYVLLFSFFSSQHSLVAQETTSAGGLSFSLMSPFDRPIGWSDTYLANELPIRTELPPSMQSERWVNLQSAIRQVNFQNRTTVADREEIVEAKPTSQSQIIVASVNPTTAQLAGQIPNQLPNSEAIPTDLESSTPLRSLVATTQIPTEPPPVVIAADVNQEIKQESVTETHIWKPRTAPLIDPNLCGSESDRGTGGTADSNAPAHRCGHCESCIENVQNSAGLMNIKSRINRSRERFRQTLLGEASLFNERPHGSSLNAVLYAQTLQGAKTRCAIWEFDFDRNPDGSPTAKLKNTTMPRLKLIANLMRETGNRLRLQSSGNSSLDDRRSNVIVEQFKTIGLAIPASAIEITASRTHEQSGIESDLQFRSRITQGVRGNSGSAAQTNSAPLPSSN